MMISLFRKFLSVVTLFGLALTAGLFYYLGQTVKVSRFMKESKSSVLLEKPTAAPLIPR
jgi:hypothetical protein